MKATTAQIRASQARLRRYLRRVPLPPHYGEPHPAQEYQKALSDFEMSIFDAAPKHIRMCEWEDGVSVGKWWEPLNYDPRPYNNRPPHPDDVFYEDSQGNIKRRPPNFFVLSDIFR